MPEKRQPFPDRIFRELLRLFPVDFRSDFGSEMEDVFREQRRDATRQGEKTGLFRLWGAAVLGIVWTAAREHMDVLREDAGYGLRLLRKTPGFTVVAVLSLALAIAGNTTVFSLLYGLLLRPRPYADPAQLVLLWQSDRNRAIDVTFVSPANFLDWRERSRSFEDMAALQGRSMSVSRGDRAEPVAGAEVSVSIFELMGVEAALGRTFLTEEGQPGRNGVVVLSHRFWQSRFASDPSLVGQTVTLDGRPHRVVGVMPEGFEFVNSLSEVWVPLTFDANRRVRDRRTMAVWARLKPNISVDQAKAEMQVIGQRLEQEYPEDNRGFGARVMTIREFATLGGNFVLLLQGALVFVLLIACANLASLLLARGQARQVEIGLRIALGAPRHRIVRQLLTESFVLAALGGALGCFVAVWGVKVVAAGWGQMARPLLPHMDPQVLAFSVGISILAGLMFGAAPAFQASNAHPAVALRNSVRVVGIGSRRLVVKGLVVAEVALALVMVSGAAAFIGGSREWQRVAPGFEVDHLLTARLGVPADSYTTDQELAGLSDRLLERVQRVPGVTAAAVTNGLPMSAIAQKALFTIDVGKAQGTTPRVSTTLLSVSSGYLRTMQVPLLQGRAFAASDRASAPPVVLINDALRRLYWPDTSPVGHRLTIRGASREVVGVTGNVRQTLYQQHDSPEPIAYLPQAQVPQTQAPGRLLILLLRTVADPQTLAAALRDAVTDIDPQLMVVETPTMEEVVARNLARYEVIDGLLVGFGLLAAALAAIGIAGVMAFSVTRRTHEIGVRMALGAHRLDIVRSVIPEGLTLAGLGFGLGLPGVVLVSRAVPDAFLGVTPVAPAAAVAVALGFLLVAVVASYLPARRAARVDPMTALRCE